MIPEDLLKKTAITKNDEVADKKHYTTDLAKKQEEAKYDGFYATCTDLEDDQSIITAGKSKRLFGL